MSASPNAGMVRLMQGRTATALAAVALALTACATSPSPSATVGTAQTATALPSASTPAEPSPTPRQGAGGPAWRRVQAAGDQPAAREDHTLTVSPDGATAYLFGGRTADGQALDDFWALDLATATWSRVVGNGPPARFGHNAAWVDGIGLVIFAGQSSADFYNDLWAYQPASDRWRELPAGGDVPVARYGSCAAVGPDGRLWISHGFTSEGTRFADTRAYDFAVKSWTDETPAAERPVERCLHGCWWTDDGSLALYGGQTTGVSALGDLWQLTPGPRPGTDAWTEIDPADRWPADRQLYAAARWGDGTLVVGGRGLDGAYLNDAWLIADDGTASRLRTDRAPPGRSGAELIADPRRERVLLFGGRDGDGAFDDLWELTLPAR